MLTHIKYHIKTLKIISNKCLTDSYKRPYISERILGIHLNINENNSRERVQVITLRSGKQLREDKRPVKDGVRLQIDDEEDPQQQVDDKANEKGDEVQKEETLSKEEKVQPPPHKSNDKGKRKELSTHNYSNLPFPSILTNPREETQYSKFLKC